MGKRRKMDMSVILPEEYISDAILHTCARNACKFAVVSTVFKSAADSDAVWEKFLPSDYQEIISGSATPSMLTAQLSRKDPYLHLCHNPIIINNGTMVSYLSKLTYYVKSPSKLTYLFCINYTVIMNVVVTSF